MKTQNRSESDHLNPFDLKRSVVKSIFPGSVFADEAWQPSNYGGHTSYFFLSHILLIYLFLFSFLVKQLRSQIKLQQAEL